VVSGGKKGGGKEFFCPKGGKTDFERRRLTKPALGEGGRRRQHWHMEEKQPRR